MPKTHSEKILDFLQKTSKVFKLVTEIRSTRNTDIDLLNTKIPVLDQQLAALENFKI